MRKSVKTRTVKANMLDAKTRLSSLVDLVESGEVDEVIVARNGRPAVRIVPLSTGRAVKLGVARGRFTMPGSIDRRNAAILRLFEGPPDAPAA